MILGVIVTHNPNLEDLTKNIYAIKCQLDKLVIFDNNSVNQDSLKDLSSKWNIEIIAFKENIGLGAAYNFVFKRYFNLFDYFVTFDQDTLLQHDAIKRLLLLFEVTPKVGIVGPSYINSYSNINQNYIFVDSLIQSCSIYPKIVFKEVGYFNEKLFIDSVDFEYCLRVQIGGYKIIKSTRVFISHELGIAKKRYGITYTDHSAFRNFYIARNHKYISKIFFYNFPYFILKKNVFFFLHILKLIFLDQNLNKLKSLIKGLKSNLNN